MSRITLKNLSGVQGLNKVEMKAAMGGQFIGVFPNWTPGVPCRKRVVNYVYWGRCPVQYVPVLH